MKNKVTLGLIGCGTVGGGVVKILEAHRREMERRCGARLELRTVCDKLYSLRRGS